jgi:hypothetical protein
MGAVSDDRGPEEIPVLMELEIQHWADEALENATRATGRILGRAASMGVRLPSLDQEEASDFDLTTSKAAQAVMRAVTAYPLSDAQLERSSEDGTGEEGPRYDNHHSRREPPPPPGNNVGGWARRRPSGRAGGDV